MSPPETGAPPHHDATTRLTALWDAHSPRVQAYAMRRTDADTAQDVLSETFLVAWRRIDEVPDPALPWLLVVARNLVANSVRGARRRRVLDETLSRLEAASPVSVGAPEALVAERDLLLRALAALTEREREALLLVAWDGLSPTDAAAVAGCSVPAFHVRLHRARRRLGDEMPPVAAERHQGTAPSATPTPRRSA